MRKDKNELKTQGVIIDGYLANKNNVENLIDKIIGYYINFETMAMDNLTSADKFNTYVELLNRTSFDVNSNMINIRQGITILRLNLKLSFILSIYPLKYDKKIIKIYFQLQ